MSIADDVERWVRLLGAQPVPSAELVQKTLAVSLTLTSESKTFQFYEGEATAPFGAVDFRISKTEDKALFVLYAAEGEVIEESALAAERLGKPYAIDVNPRIAPEGVVEELYALEHAELAVQLRAKSRTLRAISLHWGGR